MLALIGQINNELSYTKSDRVLFCRVCMHAFTGSATHWKGKILLECKNRPGALIRHLPVPLFKYLTIHPSMIGFSSGLSEHPLTIRVSDFPLIKENWDKAVGEERLKALVLGKPIPPLPKYEFNYPQEGMKQWLK